MPDQQVTIVAWPKETAKLEHQFDESTTCPVKVSFGETPANVSLQFPRDERLNVDMNMAVAVRNQIPVCVRLCEPICAASDYTVGITVFDTPVMTVRLKGLTRIFNCRDNAQPAPQSVCVDFKNRKVGQAFTGPFTLDEVTFTPAAGPIGIANFGDPQGQSKLEFPSEGVRISFAQPVQGVRIMVCNYATASEVTHVDTTWPIVAFQVAGANGTTTATETVANTVKDVSLQGTGVESVEVRHAQSRAAIVRVCYTPMAPGIAYPSTHLEPLETI